jgi:hypothetical protein
MIKYNINGGCFIMINNITSFCFMYKHRSTDDVGYIDMDFMDDKVNYSWSDTIFYFFVNGVELYVGDDFKKSLQQYKDINNLIKLEQLEV